MSAASFPCSQRGPQALVFSFLQGLQGQIVDRTSQDQLRQDKELLLEEQLKNQDIIKQMGERLEEISKRQTSYLSPQVFDRIFSNGTAVSEKHQQKNLTVFFSDIVSFTDLTVTPRLSPKAAPHQARHYHCPQPKPDYQILAPAPDRLSDRSKSG